ELRMLRKEMADERNVPPYVLFSDATLRDLCRYFPSTKDEVLQIKGIGEKKFSQYGEPFLQAIIKWKKDNPNIKEKVQIGSTPKRSVAKSVQNLEDDTPSHMQSLKLFQSGKAIKDIAKMRDVQEQTIESHLFKAYNQGFPIAWGIFFNGAEEAAVLQAHKSLEDKRLKPLKEALSDEYTYRKIKAVLVKNKLL